MMKVAGLAIILGQIDSLAPSICGNARFRGCVVAWREMGGPRLGGWLGVNASESGAIIRVRSLDMTPPYRGVGPIETRHD
jgi:hypothetical protein